MEAEGLNKTPAPTAREKEIRSLLEARKGKGNVKDIDVEDILHWSTRGGAVDGKDTFHYPITIYDPDNKGYETRMNIIWKWKVFYEKHHGSTPNQRPAPSVRKME